MNAAALEQYRRPISKEEINELPLCQYTGAVVVVEESEAVSAAVETLRRDMVLGFDTETRPSFKKGKFYPPALLQLACSESVFLFRLNRVGLPADVRDLLADPAVTKAGVAVRDDVKELRALSPFEPHGFVDLGDVARRMEIKTHGLRNLAANFMAIRISKTARTTNWSAPALTRQQVCYAATDAWISRELHCRMREAGLL